VYLCLPPLVSDGVPSFFVMGSLHQLKPAPMRSRPHVITNCMAAFGLCLVIPNAEFQTYATRIPDLAIHTTTGEIEGSAVGLQLRVRFVPAALLRGRARDPNEPSGPHAVESKAVVRIEAVAVSPRPCLGCAGLGSRSGGGGGSPLWPKAPPVAPGCAPGHPPAFFRAKYRQGGRAIPWARRNHNHTFGMSWAPSRGLTLWLRGLRSY
jgi:hypothetical protein